MTAKIKMTSKPSLKRIRLPLDGVLLLDKPVGFSSNDALMKAKRLLNAPKAGHTGTLDPFATGLLPLCFGEATKFSQDLLEADKTYETVVHLGVSTDTGDTEGQVVSSQDLPTDLSQAQIEAVLGQFRGDILQVPPMYSALKRDGKPLYEYARAGITLERAARAVTIFELVLLDWQAPFLRLRVKCSKGTYIRVLGEDIGNKLGVGAHLNALRRVQVGHLMVDGALTMQALEATDEAQRRSLLAPADTLLSSFPAVYLSDELAIRFLHGQRLALAQQEMALPSQQDLQVGAGRVRVYQQAMPDSATRLLGTAHLSEFSVLAPERLIACTQ